MHTHPPAGVMRFKPSFVGCTFMMAALASGSWSLSSVSAGWALAGVPSTLGGPSRTSTIGVGFLKVRSGVD